MNQKSDREIKINVANEMNKWLKKNAKKFPYKLVPSNKKSNYLNLKIDNVPSLSISANEYCVSVCVNYEGDCIDLLLDLDISISKDNLERFYCNSCKTVARRYFKTKEDLLESHTFIPLLKWCKEKLNSRNYLLKIIWVGGSSTSRIVLPKDF